MPFDEQDPAHAQTGGLTKPDDPSLSGAGEGASSCSPAAAVSDEGAFDPQNPVSEGASVEAKKKGRHPWVVPSLLFVLTAVTTLLAGAFQEGANPFRNPLELLAGLPFAVTLLLILFCHEMGHYIASRRYGVEVTPPYFIPGPWFPFGIGTFGAFIRIKSPIFKKNALLDIGAAGPIAGFIVSIFAVAIGLQSSQIVQMSSGMALIRLGDPLIFTLIAKALGKVPPEGYDLALNSVAFAGWIGFFVTTLNLLPIGQLDGGHITYALLGKKHRYISMAAIVILLMLGLNGWKGWYLWAALTSFIGVNHPPVIDGPAPLDFKHRMVALASLIIFIVTFMPNPFMVV